jgi:hypothetical protein
MLATTRSAAAAVAALASKAPLGARASSTAAPRAVTVAKGDGVGPEIMNSTLEILQAAKANLT